MLLQEVAPDQWFEIAEKVPEYTPFGFNRIKKKYDEVLKERADGKLGNPNSLTKEYEERMLKVFNGLTPCSLFESWKPRFSSWSSRFAVSEGKMWEEELDDRSARLPFFIKKTGGIALLGSAIFVNRKKFIVLCNGYLRERDHDDPNTQCDGEKNISNNGKVFAVWARVVALKDHDPKIYNKTAMRSGRFNPHSFLALAGHLESGLNKWDGESRVVQLKRVNEFLESLAGGTPVILGMDGNYDQNLHGHNYDGDMEEFNAGWRDFADRSAEVKNEDPRAPVFVNFPDCPNLRKTQRYGYMQALYNPGVNALVSVNRMRGPFSAQMKKHGEYQLSNIDLTMVRRARGTAVDTGAANGQGGQNLRHIQVLNGEEIQVYPRKVAEQLNEQSPIEEILKLNHDLVEGKMGSVGGLEEGNEDAVEAAAGDGSSTSEAGAAAKEVAKSTTPAPLKGKPKILGFLDQLLPNYDNPSDHLPVWTLIGMEGLGQ